MVNKRIFIPNKKIWKLNIPTLKSHYGFLDLIELDRNQRDDVFVNQEYRMATNALARDLCISAGSRPSMNDEPSLLDGL